ncbi:MAG: tetratricopeptide repeat protein [Gammaproteobacteria bacterium]
MIIFITVLIISLLIFFFLNNLNFKVLAKTKDSVIGVSLFFLIVIFLYFGPLDLGNYKEVEVHNIIYESLDRNELEDEFQFKEIEDYLLENKLNSSELYYLAQEFKKINKYKISLFFLEILIKDYPREIPSEIFSERTQILFFLTDKKFTNEVISSLEMALENDPNNPISLTILGIKSIEEGDIKGAKSAWSMALKNISNQAEKEALQVAIDSLDLIKNQ